DSLMIADVGSGLVGRLFLPVLVLFLSVLGIFVLVVFEVVIQIVVVFFVVAFFVVVLGRKVELNRRETGHLEIGAAFGATELVALIDIEFVDFDVGIAFRAGGHMPPRRVEPAWRFGNGIGEVPEAGGGRKRDRCPDYSDFVRKSATHSNVTADRLRYLLR